MLEYRYCGDLPRTPEDSSTIKSKRSDYLVCYIILIQVWRIPTSLMGTVRQQAGYSPNKGKPTSAVCVTLSKLVLAFSDFG